MNSAVRNERRDYCFMIKMKGFPEDSPKFRVRNFWMQKGIYHLYNKITLACTCHFGRPSPTLQETSNCVTEPANSRQNNIPVIVCNTDQNDDGNRNLQTPTMSVFPSSEITEGNSVFFNIRSSDSICGVFSMFKNGKKIGPPFFENHFKLNNTTESDSGEYRCMVNVGGPSMEV